MLSWQPHPPPSTPKSRSPVNSHVSAHLFYPIAYTQQSQSNNTKQPPKVRSPNTSFVCLVFFFFSSFIRFCSSFVLSLYFMRDVQVKLLCFKVAWNDSFVVMLPIQFTLKHVCFILFSIFIDFQMWVVLNNYIQYSHASKVKCTKQGTLRKVWLVFPLAFYWESSFSLFH